MHRQQLLCCSFCHFMREVVGVVVTVEVTAVVLQFLSFHCGGGCDCTGDSFCVCSFRFVSFHEGGGCECTGNSCCVAVSVIS